MSTGNQHTSGTVNILKAIVLTITFLSFALNSDARIVNSSVSGDWESTTSWSCGCIPGNQNGDTIRILSTHIITVTGANTKPSSIVVINVLGTIEFDGQLTLENGSSVNVIGAGRLRDLQSNSSNKLNVGNGGGSYTWKGTDPSPINVSLPTNTPLPVELLYFNVKSNNKKVLISWATSQEVNNKGFEVEKSYDGILFHSLIYVEGKGNSQIINPYQTEDTDLKGKIIYYRLKQIDFNGQIETFNIKSVSINKSDNHISLFPNPCKSNESIFIELPNIDINQETTIEILDKVGQVVFSKVCTNYDSGFSFIINLNNELSGLYIIKASNNQQVYQHKILIQ